jgi:hypothetical protein
LETDPDVGNKKKARILRNLKKAEDMKQMFQKLQILCQVRANSGITRIEIPVDPHDDPKKCTEWQVIDVPTQILHHLQSRNRQHFGQAQNTPFTQEPLLTELGFTGHTDAGNSILQGHYDASKLEKPVQLLIAHLQQHNLNAEDTQVPLQSTITEEAYIAKLKRWSESTSTSPSGLHLGHYKALIAVTEYSDMPSDDKRRIRWDSNAVRDTICTFTTFDLCYATGIFILSVAASVKRHAV